MIIDCWYLNPDDSFILMLKTFPLEQGLTIWLEITSGCPRGVIVKANDCRIVVSEFELYHVHFRANTLGEMYEPTYPAN